MELREAVKRIAAARPELTVQLYVSFFSSFLTFFFFSFSFSVYLIVCMSVSVSTCLSHRVNISSRVCFSVPVPVPASSFLSQRVGGVPLLASSPISPISSFPTIALVSLSLLFLSLGSCILNSVAFCLRPSPWL